MLKFDKNLSIIHAYLCAEGYVIKNPETQKQRYYHIGFRNTNLVLLKDFQIRFEKFFGLKPYITNDGRCRIQSKKVYKFLTENFSYYSRKWKMPDLDRYNLRYWLRAFFDCEGWVLVKKAKNRHIGTDSVNQRGLIQIHNSLKKFGIESIIKSLKKRKTLRLFIYGKENLTKFQKEIGFLHPAKKAKLQEAIDSYVNYYWNFPEDEEKLKYYIIHFINKRTKIDKNFRLRICSNLEQNLIILSKHLKNIFRVESKLYGPKFSGIGTKFYELAIHKKEDVNKCKELFKL
ncbi:hypothetical protein KY347_00680 [Candidatus Woesearchaeota archaeon]|nr:hypothetical protein [Candidatus Woesearchaeota archaeon]